MKTLLRLLQRFYNWALCYRDSTRSVGLIRIGLVLLIWSEWAGELILCRDIRLGAILLNSTFFLTYRAHVYRTMDALVINGDSHHCINYVLTCMGHSGTITPFSWSWLSSLLR